MSIIARMTEPSKPCGPRSVSFFVPIRPEPWQRPRPSGRGRGYITPFSVFRSRAAAEAMKVRPRPRFEGAVLVRALFHFKTTKDQRAGFRDCMPDLDNLDKNLGEALEDAGFFAKKNGDQQIAATTIIKANMLLDGREGCVVEVRELFTPEDFESLMPSVRFRRLFECVEPRGQEMPESFQRSGPGARRKSPSICESRAISSTTRAGGAAV